MGQTIGRGFCGSLRARVNHEIATLFRENQTLRQAKYSRRRRLLRALVVDNPIENILLAYAVIAVLMVVAEWAVNRYAPGMLLGYKDANLKGFMKDVGSYLIAAQVGILAIVSVAVGVVTLLSDRAGSAVNTDIRLYYVESYSYEVATSGVALLIVVVAQLFWPLQHLLHVAGLGGADLSFKLALTAVHAVWFCCNAILFFQFITTTLRFVEPSARERLRERYVANEIVPEDVAKRLLRVLYLNAPEQLVGKDTLEPGPSISFSRIAFSPKQPVAEITDTFARDVVLRDVWLRPIGWVLRRWHKRAQAPGKSQLFISKPHWDGGLYFLPDFDGLLSGRQEWVKRDQTIALNPIERWVVRQAFRFAEPQKRGIDLPSPDDFIEQLVDQVLDQINKAAESGFEAALSELVTFHRFLLAIQNTTDENGKPLNLAEVGGLWSRPDADWIREYRRLFAAAVGQLSNNTAFIERLGNLPWRLLPEDVQGASARVLIGILDLGVYAVIELEEWVTRRTSVMVVEPGADAPPLAGSDRAAYEKVLISLVGAWETLEQYILIGFGRRQEQALADENRWAGRVASATILRRHLTNTAYFLASAVWNNDGQGSDRYRDLLLRWLNPFYDELQEQYRFPNAALIKPDILKLRWQDARAAVGKHALYEPDKVPVKLAFGLFLKELHYDVICVTGLVALHWFANAQQPSENAREAAIKTLRRERRAGDGSDLTASGTQPKSVFHMLFDFMLRYSLSTRWEDGSYASEIDQLVQTLTNLAAPRMVSGRIYSGWGLEGYDTLRPDLLAAMAANLPARGDDGALEFAKGLVAQLIEADDALLSRLISSLEIDLRTLTDLSPLGQFNLAFLSFRLDLDPQLSAKRLRDLFEEIITFAKAARIERMQNAPMDEGKLDEVRATVTTTMRSEGPDLPCFATYPIGVVAPNEIPPETFRFGVMDRGAFTNPSMSGVTFGDLPPLFAEVTQNNLARFVLRGLYKQPRREISIDLADGTDPFWRAMLEESANVGPEPMVLVPYDPFAHEIQNALMPIQGTGGMEGFDLTREQQVPTGNGIGYVGTINGVRVYTAPFPRDLAILCSRQSIARIDYGPIHGDQLIDLEFEDSADPEKSWVRMTVDQRITWAGHEHVAFNFPSLSVPPPPDADQEPE